MHCKNCNKEIEKDSKFCQYCGEKASEETTQLELPVSIDEIRNHLEFMGYQVGNNTQEDNRIRFTALHGNHPNLIFTYFPVLEIYSIVCIFTINEISAETKKRKFEEAINKLNLTTLITTFCGAEGYDSLTCATWHSNHYSRKEFANFLELFEGEINRGIYSDLMKDFV